MGWIARAREVLVRGVAAAQVLADHHPHQDPAVEVSRSAAGDGPRWPQAASGLARRCRPGAAAGITAPNRRRPRWRLSCRTCWRTADVTTAPTTPPRCAWPRGRCWLPASAPSNPSSRAWAAAQPLVGRPRQGGAAGRG
jgi:hypothetical protein